MKRVRNWLALLAGAGLGVLAAAAAAGPAPGFAPLARSSLVTVDAARNGGVLILRVRRTAEESPLAGAQLQVRLDRHVLPLTAGPDGTWDAALDRLASSSDGTLEITVAHDGVREVLSGRLPAVAGAGARSGTVTGGLLNVHRQLAWWILNIVVVLIGVIAVSRRMS